MEQEMAEKVIIGIVGFIILFLIISIKRGIDNKIKEYKESKRKNQS